jgi:diphosphomevalonate decarboxylase
MSKATAVAHANIAFIKYWGHADLALMLPANSSISMNLDCLSTTTSVLFDKDLVTDEVTINDLPADKGATQRVSAHLDRLRALAKTVLRARVVSCNSFPIGAGMASSASAFAALTVAASAALGLALAEDALAALAGQGSGSACRSIPSGFVEWAVDREGKTSAVRSVAPPSHWALCDCIAVVSAAHKETGSRAGHASAPTSSLHSARVARTTEQVAACRKAIQTRNLVTLGEAMEADAIMMHAVAMTSHPPIYYWTSDTLRVMRCVASWRAEGIPVYYTIDAGPNVHCLCERPYRDRVTRRLEMLPGVERVLVACPGPGAHRVSGHLL